MKNKFIFGLAGLVILSSTLGSLGLPVKEAKKEFKHPFGNAMIIKYLLPNISLDYDTDKDGISDLRMVYTIAKISKQNEIIYELARVVKDRNGNHQFDKDEVIYENPKYFPEEEIPKGERIWI